MVDKIVEILHDTKCRSKLLPLREVAEKIAQLDSAGEEVKLFEVTYRYTNRTDASIHYDRVIAKNCVEACNMVCANHNFEVEWHTVKELSPPPQQPSDSAGEEVVCKLCQDDGWIDEHEGRTVTPCPQCGGNTKDYKKHLLSNVGEEVSEKDVVAKYDEWVRRSHTPLTRKMAWMKCAEWMRSKLTRPTVSEDMLKDKDYPEDYGKPLIYTVSEEEIQSYITECEEAYGRPASLAIEIGICWIMDKLNQGK